MLLELVAYALAAFVLATALATAALRDVLSVIVVFGAYSLGMAILYSLLRAPDVAMTEAAIGAGVTSILLLLTLTRTSRPATDRVFERVNVPALVACAAFVLVVGLAVVPDLYPVGAKSPVWTDDVTQHYIQNTYERTGITNTVASVLAAYRGFDTFGEAVVVFAAAVAVLVALKREVFA
ncbi:DUF4040 domain-containing protein [Natrialbaceae archaeon GCM10025810]|uniref:DUF4040 domain-containing protein n=1 Tax=Halovalidus salilacus TaxID=3075124 RepID=UPI0036064E8B